MFNFLFKENRDLQKQKVQSSLAFTQVYYSVLTKVTKDLNSEKNFFKNLYSRLCNAIHHSNDLILWYKTF